MRIAIIILGIIALLVLALKWDTLSPDSEVVPREGSVLNSNDKHSEHSVEGKRVICPKCKKVDDVAFVSENSYVKTCKIHDTSAINL